MAHRINERNIGNHLMESSPKKKRGNKLTADEWAVLELITGKVYDAMEFDETIGKHVDGGRIVLALTGEEMYDLFEAKRKLNSQIINQKWQ